MNSKILLHNDHHVVRKPAKRQHPTRPDPRYRRNTTVPYPLSSLIPRPPARVLVREPSQALLTGIVEANGLPYLPLGAGFLDEARGLAEAGEREGEVLAREGVGVVLAHYEACSEV